MNTQFIRLLSASIVLLLCLSNCGTKGKLRPTPEMKARTEHSSNSLPTP